MNNKLSKELIAIVGPTAVGKSKVALNMADKVDGEIINADSMQIYRYLDIGTAKPCQEERKIVPHHLFDIVNPDEFFSVADYQQMALEVINNIRNRGKQPILVGGTGLYITAVTKGFVFLGDKPDKNLRSQLLEKGKTIGSKALHDELKTIDPKAAKRIHPNDLRRISRAIEFYKTTGKPISSQWDLTEKNNSQQLPHKIFGLYMSRDLLYKRINERVDKMMEEGFLEEVKLLLNKGYDLRHKAMQSLGYRHMLLYLNGSYTLKEAVELMKRDTRRYAKRQLTWFKKEKEITWVHIEDNNLEKITKRIYNLLEG